ncbi:MAG: pyruvate dehydrogenase complex dihydrolipoamide acetyltransferase [Balneolaceae bacterium]
MAEKIEMPKLSDTMEEGVIAKWNVKEGDTVSSGDVIAEVETDKATMEVEVFESGTILKILVEEGANVPLGGLMAVIGEKGEDIEAILAEANDSAPAADETSSESTEKKSASKEGDEASEKHEKADATTSTAEPDPADQNGRIKASPLARRMAEEKGISLEQVDGSGPDGRIVKKDIESFKQESGSRTRTFDTIRSETVRVSQMRKTIARRLSESKFTSPHFYETIDVDMERSIEARSALNEVSDVKISFNDIVVKAVSHALHRHPAVNSSWKGDVMEMHGEVHVAVAVAIEEGLMTPVLRHTDQKSLREISVETRELAAKAREKSLQSDEMEGSTFTISNLGMFGIEEFTAIINPPNAGILAVGAIRDVPVVKDGEVVPGKRMKLTLSSDHRVVDGAKAAEFLQTLRGMLENPLSMLL